MDERATGGRGAPRRAPGSALVALCAALVALGSCARAAPPHRAPLCPGAPIGADEPVRPRAFELPQTTPRPATPPPPVPTR